VGVSGTEATAAAAAAVPPPRARKNWRRPSRVSSYDPGNAETRSRYRETDHVKAFYRTNGYETLKK
jgi:hypothetical protein